MVKEWVLSNDQGTRRTVPVLIYLEPGRLHAGDSQEMLDSLVKSLKDGVENSIFATLESGNLITGSTYIQIDFYPDEPPGKMGEFQGYATLPSQGGGFAIVMQQISALLHKVNRLPLEDTVGGVNVAIEELNATLTALRQLLENEETQSLAGELQATLTELQQVLAGVSPDSEPYQTLNATLYDLNRTLQNLSDFSRTLSDKPNAVIMPVKIPADPMPEARP